MEPGSTADQIIKLTIKSLNNKSPLERFCYGCIFIQFCVYIFLYDSWAKDLPISIEPWIDHPIKNMFWLGFSATFWTFVMTFFSDLFGGLRFLILSIIVLCLVDCYLVYDLMDGCFGDPVANAQRIFGSAKVI